MTYVVFAGHDDTGVRDHHNVLGDRRGGDDLLRVGPRIGDDLREANVLPGGYSTGVDDDLQVVLLDVGRDGTVLGRIGRHEGHDDNVQFAWATQQVTESKPHAVQNAKHREIRHLK